MEITGYKLLDSKTNKTVREYPVSLHHLARKRADGMDAANRANRYYVVPIIGERAVTK